MIWSRERFEDEGRQLCRCLLKCRIENNYYLLGGSLSSAQPQNGGFVLVNWEIRRDTTGSFLFLQHETITTSQKEAPNQLCNSRLHPNSHVTVQGDEAADLDLEDYSIFNDSEVFVDAGEDSTKVPKASVDDTVLVQWTFSIVYSDTYRVPVLYFHVQHPDGSLCSRSQVIQWLSPDYFAKKSNTILLTEEEPSSSSSSSAVAAAATRNEETESTWEFVSQEQHPVTGFPSYFLHPCRTAERMQLLQQVGRGSSIDNSLKTASSVNFLWVWMSMILPAVNHSIPPRVFDMVQEQLKMQTNNNNTTAKT